MTIQASIEEKLGSDFQPLFLEVVNESHKHNVPKGSESHFKVVMVSNKFEGKPLVGRHRMVNKTLSHELENGVHALSLKLMTPAQWEASGQSHNHQTPDCAHKK